MGISKIYSGLGGGGRSSSLTGSLRPIVPEQETWTKPAEWLSVPELTASDNELAFLVQIRENGIPDIAFLIYASGDWTVDWGDGTTTNYNGTQTASHSYTWSTLNTGDRLSDGTGQAVVRITPDTGADQIQGARFLSTYMNTAFGYGVGYTGFEIKDMIVALPDLTSTHIAFNTSTSAYANAGTSLERIRFVEMNGWMPPNYAFAWCLNLRHVELPEITSGGSTGGQRLFWECHNLTYLNQFEAPNFAGSLVGMFYNCYSLVDPPNINAPNAANTSQLFYGCTSMQKSPTVDHTSSATASSLFLAADGMQAVDNALTDIPPLNLGQAFQNAPYIPYSAVKDLDYGTDWNYRYYQRLDLPAELTIDFNGVTSASYMFQGCTTVRKITLQNVSSLKTCVAMFRDCESLREVVIESGTFAPEGSPTYMFAGCHSLREVPNIDWSSASLNSIQGIFEDCYSLKEAHLGTLGVNVSAIRNAFDSCYSLVDFSMDFAPVSTTVNGSQMFSNCYRLQRVGGTMNWANMSTGGTNIFGNCRSLSRIESTNFDASVTVSYSAMDATELDRLYTGLGTVTSQTITVTGSVGTGSDTPLIATAKGWTVTG